MVAMPCQHDCPHHRGFLSAETLIVRADESYDLDYKVEFRQIMTGQHLSPTIWHYLGRRDIEEGPLRTKD